MASQFNIGSISADNVAIGDGARAGSADTTEARTHGGVSEYNIGDITARNVTFGNGNMIVGGAVADDADGL